MVCNVKMTINGNVTVKREMAIVRREGKERRMNTGEVEEGWNGFSSAGKDVLATCKQGHEQIVPL